jgi:hypothetical protein
MLELVRIQAALGVLEAPVEPDLNFVKYVTMGVIMVDAKVTGGRSCFMFILYENNYHVKNILERQVEIPGLGEYFAVPCKFIYHKVLMLITRLLIW